MSWLRTERKCILVDLIAKSVITLVILTRKYIHYLLNTMENLRIL